MESFWIIVLLIIGTILRGCTSTTMKVISHKKLDYDKVIFIMLLVSFILSIILYDFSIPPTKILLLIISISLVQIFQVKFVFLIFENLSASTFMISFRTISTIVLLFIGMILFGEFITIYQYLGIFLGFLVFFLLLDKDDKPHKDANFKKGLIYLAFYIIIISVSNTIGKYISISNPVSENLVLIFFFMLLFSILNLIRLNKFNLIFEFPKEKKDYLPLLVGLFSFGNFSIILFAYSQEFLIIVYKIYSFEIIIPIIYSIIVYKEKVTKRKIAAFILTIASILLLT